MKKLRVYLDNCCFNRPFDPQDDIRIRLESEAKLEVQNRIYSKQLDLVWSYILDFENNANPFDERKEAIGKWRAYASVDVEESKEILEKAESIMQKGIKGKDALHMACAIMTACDYFLTTDDEVLSKMKEYDAIKVMNPVDFLVGEKQ